jgi:hypothetical protein
MAKASLTLPNGASVTIEGTTEEVRALLEHYGATRSQPTEPQKKKRGRPRRRPVTPERDLATPATNETNYQDTCLAEVVNLIKTCDEADAIGEKILNRTSQVDRTLLPLYIVHEYLGNARGLSSGDVYKITRELGVPVSTPNVSTTLSSTAAKYVIGDRIRRQGQQVLYKLSRKGVQYMKNVIGGGANENAG